MSQLRSALSNLMPISLWERTIFVKCIPIPANFTERRAVLRALQKETSEGIEVFKKMKRDSSSFIAVTTRIEIAKALIENSPFERTFIVEDSTKAGQSREPTWGDTSGARRTVTALVNPLPTDLHPTPTTDDTNDLGLSHGTFSIHCFPPNKTFNHLRTVRTHPLHGPWPDNDGRETFISATLRRSVPPGLMAPALRDWVTGGQLSRFTETAADEKGEGALSLLIGRSREKTYQWEQIVARKKERNIPEIMHGLARFSEKYRRDLPPPANAPGKQSDGAAMSKDTTHET